MKEIFKIMQNFGISENEARVYLAMLKTGDAPISRVAKVAKLNRVTVHHIVSRLESIGLAVSFNKGSYKVVRPAHPARLQKKIEESKEMFEKVLPQLVAIMRDDTEKTKPVVRMYYGVDGFEKVAEELLEKSNGIIYHIGSLAEAHKFIGLKYDREYFVPTRISKNIHYKAIYHKDEEKPAVIKSNIEDLREVKYFPDGFGIKNNTFIVPGKVIIVSTEKELMSVVIESEDISKSEIEKFQLIWKLLDDSLRSKN